MRCPQCDGTENRVVDTRTSRGGRAVRRRRDGSSEEFDRDKLTRSLRIACAKRPVSASEMEALVDEIEDDLSRRAGVEVASSLIGELVMERLKPLDRVAYVRFASVYRNFQDIEEFQDFVDDLNTRQRLEAQAREQAELGL